MVNYKYLLFDLDGTLIDTTEGVLKSAAYALEYLGHPVQDWHLLKPYMGPPLMYSFVNFSHLTETDAKTAVNKYRERYSQKGIHECSVYSGIPELLCSLQMHGYHLAVATSKQETIAVQVLQEFQLLPFFETVSGSTPDETISTKSQVIRQAAERLCVTDFTEMLMIGDRKYDIEGAKLCGIDSLGIYTGTADPNEFEKAGATFVANSLQEIQRYLL